MGKPLGAVARSFALGALVLLAGCATPSAPEFEAVSFSGKPLLILDVESIRVEDQAPTAGTRSIVNQFATSPAKALRIWADQRLEAAGTSVRSARFTILKAEAIETPLELTGGLKGAIKTEQEARYEMSVSARLEILSPSGESLGFAEASATRYATAPEKSSYTNLRLLWNDLVLDVMADFDREMEARVRSGLSKHLVSG